MLLMTLEIASLTSIKGKKGPSLMHYPYDLLVSKVAALEAALRLSTSMESARKIRIRLRETEEAVELIRNHLNERRKHERANSSSNS